jgi:hypothetical protein
MFFITGTKVAYYSYVLPNKIVSYNCAHIFHNTFNMHFTYLFFMCLSESTSSGCLDSYVSDVPQVTSFWYMINHLALELNTCSDLQKTGI